MVVLDRNMIMFLLSLELEWKFSTHFLYLPTIEETFQ